MDYREEFRAKVRAALDEYESCAGKENPTEAFIDAVTDAARTWADQYGAEQAIEARPWEW